MDEIEQLLRAWMAAVWPNLLAYQRRFVENGYTDDGSWAYDMGTLAFERYEWVHLRSVMEQVPETKRRLLSDVSTALGGITTGDNSRAIGRSLLDAAYAEIKAMRLLRLDYESFFNSRYEAIHSYLVGSDINYVSLTLLHNARIDQRFVLDGEYSLEPMHGQPRTDPRWRGTLWDSENEVPAQLHRRFSLPTEAKPEISVQSVIDATRFASDRVVMAIALVQPSTVTAGPTLLTSDGFIPSAGGSLTFPGSFPLMSRSKTILNDHLQLLARVWLLLPLTKSEQLRRAGKRLVAATMASDQDSVTIEFIGAIEAIIGRTSGAEQRYRSAIIAARLCAAKMDKSEREVYDSVIEGFQVRADSFTGAVHLRHDKAHLANTLGEIARRLVEIRVMMPQLLTEDQAGTILRGQ